MLVTGILDLDIGRLVDVLPARSAAAVTAWLASKPLPWLARIRHVVIDPTKPYATAVAAGLPDARLVVDHFHVIRLANAALDEVRRRTQQATTGHRPSRRVERPCPREPVVGTVIQRSLEKGKRRDGEWM
jgi:transposase